MIKLEEMTPAFMQGARSTGRESGPMLQGIRDVPFGFIDPRGGDHGPLRDALLRPVPHLYHGDQFYHSGCEGVVHVLVDQDTVRTDACLPGVPEGGGDNPLSRLLQVGILEETPLTALALAEL